MFLLLLSSKGIEPFTAVTNSFTENHHYQSDHLPLLKQNSKNLIVITSLLYAKLNLFYHIILVKGGGFIY